MNSSDSNIRFIEEIPLVYRSVFGGYPCFNTIQSAVLDDALKTDNCLVVSAPTGSGKTAIFEMAIIRLLMLNENNGGSLNFKIIYISPIKALCMERLIDWHKKFSGFGIKCISLTSDSDNFDIKNVNYYNLLIATPEKWDVITRKWRDNKNIVESISLFMIDEVHLLNDSRGSTLEVIVSRMKTAESIMMLNSENTKIRFIALSATIPNIDDIAEWIEPNGTAKLFKFSENVRPVKLNKVVHGFSLTTNSIFKFELSLNYKLPNLIYKYSEGKPTLIFCSTRKSVEMTTNHLLKNLQIRLAQDQKEILNQISMKIGDVKLKQYVASGIALHHAGLVLENRNTIEDAFRNGHLPILVTTSTLAMGVNLPAHLVIVKGTKRYDSKDGYKDYDEVAIFQMIGRAGRSQFDTSATALILTSTQDKLKYEQMLSCTQNIESNLHKHLTEHLNAEIVLKTITDLEVAMSWLSSTFLYVRARKNPEKYKLPAGLPKEKIDKKLLEICQISLNKLVRAGMIKMNQEIEMAPTVVGEIMAKYYIAFKTMEMFTKINGDEIMIQLLALFSKCHEFSEIYLRSNDKKCLNLLNKNPTKESNRFPLTGRIKSVDMKINCIIQAVLGNLDINDQSVLNDATRVMRNCERLAKCLIEYLETRTKCYTALLNTIILAKCFYVKLWENSPYVSKQLTGVGRVISSLLAKAGKTTFKEIINTSPRHIEMIVGRKAPFGNTLVEQALHIPEYQMTLERSNSTAVLKIELLNPGATKETPTVKLDSTMTLLVGDSGNNILLYEKYSHFYMLDNPKITRIINIDNDNLNFVAASLISDDWVGIDCQAKLKFSVEPTNTPNETRILPNKNNKQTYMDMYMQKVRGCLAPRKKHQQRSNSKELTTLKENPTKTLAVENSSKNQKEIHSNSAENGNKTVIDHIKTNNGLNSITKDQYLNPIAESPNITENYLSDKASKVSEEKENTDKESYIKKPKISNKKKILVSKSIFRTASKSEHIRKMQKRSKLILLNDKNNKNRTHTDSVLEVVDSSKQKCLSPILNHNVEKQLEENKTLSYKDQNSFFENEQNFAHFEKNYDQQLFYKSGVNKKKVSEEKENTDKESSTKKPTISNQKKALVPKSIFRTASKSEHLRKIHKRSKSTLLNDKDKENQTDTDFVLEVVDYSKQNCLSPVLNNTVEEQLEENKTLSYKDQNNFLENEQNFADFEKNYDKRPCYETGVDKKKINFEENKPMLIRPASSLNALKLRKGATKEITNNISISDKNRIDQNSFTKNKEILKRHLSEELRLNSFGETIGCKNRNLNGKIDTPKVIHKSYLEILKNKSHSREENVDFGHIVDNSQEKSFSEDFFPLSTQVNNMIDDLIENEKCVEENAFDQPKVTFNSKSCVSKEDNASDVNEHSTNFKFLVPPTCHIGNKKFSQKSDSSYSKINLSKKLRNFDEIEDSSDDEPSEKQNNESSENTANYKKYYNEDVLNCKMMAALYKKYNLKPDQIENGKNIDLLCGNKVEPQNDLKEIKSSMQPFKRQDFLTPNSKKQKRDESYSSSFEIFQPKSIKWRSPLVHSPPEKFTPNTKRFCFDFVNEGSDSKEDTGEINDIRLETQDTSSSSTNLNLSTNSQKHPRPASTSSSAKKKIKFPLSDQEYLNETLNKKIKHLNDLCDIEYFGLKEKNENTQKDTTSASQYYSQVMCSQRKNDKNEDQYEGAKTDLKDNMIEPFDSGINSPLKTLPQSPHYHSSNPAMMCSQVCEHPKPLHTIPPNPNIPNYQHAPNIYHSYNPYSHLVDESNLIHRQHFNSNGYLNQSFIKSEHPVEEFSQGHVGNCCMGDDHLLRPRSCYNPEYHFRNEFRHPEIMSPYSIQPRLISTADVRRPMPRYADPNPYFREMHSSPLLDPRYPVHQIENLHSRVAPSYLKSIPDQYVNPYHSQLIDQQHSRMGQKEVHSAPTGNHFNHPLQCHKDNSNDTSNPFYLDNKHFHNSQVAQNHDSQLSFHSPNPNRSLQQTEQSKLKEAACYQGIKGFIRDNKKSPKKQLIHDQHSPHKQPQESLFVLPRSSQRKRGSFNSFEERLESAVGPRSNGYALSSNRDHYYDARASEFSAHQYQPNDREYTMSRFHF